MSRPQSGDPVACLTVFGAMVIGCVVWYFALGWFADHFL